MIMICSTLSKPAKYKVNKITAYTEPKSGKFNVH